MSFIEDYRIYSSGNEAPPIFHDWAALSCLASFVSRRVWAPQGFFTVYPNLYMIFVGNPGNGKSTAMRIGQGLVRKMDKYCPIVPDAITKESLIKEMGMNDSKYFKQFKHVEATYDYSTALFFSDELVTLLGADPLGMIKFLTRIYDEDEKYENSTKNQGSDFIPRPFVNLLTCMTPETTSTLLKESIISGGFARRCVFIYAQRRGNPVPRPTITVEQLSALDRCMKHAALLVHLIGQFTWTPAAEQLFDEWYKRNHDFVQNNADLWLNGYYTSKSVMVIKVAMLLSLAASTNLILDAPHIHQSLVMLEANEKDMHRVFDGTGRNPEASLATHIVSMLETQTDVVDLKQLRVKMYPHGNADEIQRAIDHLKQADKLAEFTYSLPTGTTKTIVGTPEQVQRFQQRLNQQTQKLVHELRGPSNLLTSPAGPPELPVVNLRGHLVAPDQTSPQA